MQQIRGDHRWQGNCPTNGRQKIAPHNSQNFSFLSGNFNSTVLKNEWDTPHKYKVYEVICIEHLWIFVDSNCAKEEAHSLVHFFFKMIYKEETACRSTQGFINLLLCVCVCVPCFLCAHKL